MTHWEEWSPLSVLGMLVLIVLIAYGLASTARQTARAEPAPALDRQLVERAIRAMEQQAESQRDVARAVEELGRRCDR